MSGKKKWPAFQKPPQVKQHYPSVSEMTLEARSFQGPLPPPEHLAAYDQISAGFADRILKMAETEQTERHSDSRTKRGTQARLMARGQIFAFVLSLVIIGGGIYLISLDKPTSGFISILAGVATVAGPFFYRVRLAKKQQAS